jgi:DNA-binding response OmpR family regulator
MVRAWHVTGKEYQTLELLALRRGVTLTKDIFLNHLYGGTNEPEAKIIDVFILQTAKKTRRRIWRQGLHRDGLGTRLRNARAGRL